MKTFYFNFSQTYHRLRRKHQVQLVILANKAVLTTKEGLVQEPGNDQKKEDHNGYNTYVDLAILSGLIIDTETPYFPQ